jgi:hypothetical protein
MHSTTFPFIYLNTSSLPNPLLATWQSLVTSPSHDPSLPTTPLLYAFVETGHTEPRPGVRGWTALHLPGPAARGRNGIGGGGITLFYHSDCAVRHLPLYSTRITDNLPQSVPPSSSLLCAIVRPKRRSPFLLAVVYLPPPAAQSPKYLNQLLSLIESAADAHPHLPLIVVGDFNCHHADWHCPLAPSASSSARNPQASSGAQRLAFWIDSFPLQICNPPGTVTRQSLRHGAPEHSIIDLVLCNHLAVIASVTQSLATTLRSDHLPFTITLSLLRTSSPSRPPDSRPRVAWDHHTSPGVWQALLGPALTSALHPLQPSLDSLSHPIPATSTAQAVIDTVYLQLETAIHTTCLDIVGTKVIRPFSLPWLSYPGVKAAQQAQRAALRAYQRSPSSADAHQRLRTARLQWAKISKEAKLQSYSDLCEQIMSPDCKLRWSMLKRASPSTFTPLTSIVNSASNTLPSSHAASLDNLCSDFVANGTPPALSDPVAHQLLEQQVLAWTSPAQPAIPSHDSDSWSFSPAAVRDQCTRQHTNTAPGPDTLLPIFFKYGGMSLWTALSQLYTFSWTHSVTPQAWREANVMALYKGSGDKSLAGSYRPISMTSIIIRTFEHLIHRRLIAELEDSHHFSPTQFGFRKGLSTTDAIHYLLTGIQHTLRLPQSVGSIQCPVLFLDIQKAFDRVDHTILLHRVKDAGITGKAWLWLHSFLSNRRMRCVDASEHSAWLPVHYGVPQGCVLSPLLFLIFINDLMVTIQTDQGCSLLSPVFFADDGAIGPNPYRTSSIPAEQYEASYYTQLHTAIAHLNAWCSSSRMQFGAAKTQLVNFTLRQQPDSFPLRHYTLCGFNISIATEYKYLGVYLTQRLSWTRHADSALKQAKRASALVTRVALRAREVSFTAIRSLILSYVIPKFSYGILFWGRDIDLSNSLRIALQAQLATPLRVALSLPRTTHQLGVLEMCDVPTVAAIALRSQLAHLSRVCHPTTLPDNHPTKQLHLRCLNLLYTKSARLGGKGLIPHTTLSPAATLNTTTYLLACVHPRVCHAPSLAPRLPPDLHTSICHGVLPHWDKGTTYWTQKSGSRRSWAQNNWTATQLNDTIRWSVTSAANLTTIIIRQLRNIASHAEWRNSHAPPFVPPAPGAPLPHAAPALAHSTTAPLTQCKPSPGLALFLSHLSPDLPYQQASRARLLMGRARTGTIRLRFAKTSEVGTTNPNCTACSPPLPASAVPDTIEHLLLHCIRHHRERSTLLTALSSLSIHTPLILSTILLASAPPAPFSSALLKPLLQATSTFLGTISTTRASANLIPLDTG